MPTVQLKMSEESYSELKKMAEQIGETSVAALARTSLGLLSFLLERTGSNSELILRNKEKDEEDKLVFPLKKKGT